MRTGARIILCNTPESSEADVEAPSVRNPDSDFPQPDGPSRQQCISTGEPPSNNRVREPTHRGPAATRRAESGRLTPTLPESSRPRSSTPLLSCSTWTLCRLFRSPLLVPDHVIQEGAYRWTGDCDVPFAYIEFGQRDRGNRS